ncbi:uncharacterized protein LOC129921788 [Biomphalaria glabrata]|uniref:Uncharacterized protein LOC129921788 n=1 Tax=Biomphalaria glabrata TaxID=6526 RepID=A0A9W2YCY9_BIOGL|nr:uncharacterized protein LOC129921788 [Biomphalaria glabrata]
MIKFKKITTTNRNFIILWMQIASMVHSVHSDQYLTITVDVKSLNFSLIYNLSEADYNIFYSDLCNETVITVKLQFKNINLYSTKAEISRYSNLHDQSSPYVCQIVNYDFVCGRDSIHHENYTQYVFSSNAALCVKKCINFYADQELQINASNNWLTSSRQECQISTSTSSSINTIDSKTSPSPVINSVITSASNTDNQHTGDNVEGNLPLIIGCSVAGAVTITVILIVVFVVKKKQIRTNKKHSSPSTNPYPNPTFNEFLKTEDASQTVSPSNLNYYDMRSGNTEITTESSDLKSSAIKNDKSSNELYSETYARNSNNNNGSHNKKFNPAHDSANSTVDPVELNKSILRDKQVAANKAAQEPYVDFALPDQTASLYSRLRESGKDFQNVYNVSPTQEINRPQSNTSSSYVLMAKEGSAIPTRPTPSYENVVDYDAGQDVYAQVNKQGRSNRLQTRTNSSDSTVF